MLIKKHGSLAELNEKLGWTRTDPKLSQIRNANIRPGRSKSYQMGDAMAREIEEKLALERGWMDTPPTYAEFMGEEDPMAKAILALEQLDREQIPIATRLITAITQPSAAPAVTGIAAEVLSKKLTTESTEIRPGRVKS